MIQSHVSQVLVKLRPSKHCKQIIWQKILSILVPNCQKKDHSTESIRFDDL